AGRSPVRDARLKDDAVVGRVIGEPARAAVEAGGAALDIRRREGGNLLEGDAEGLAGEAVVLCQRGDPQAIEAEASMVRARPAAEDPTITEAFTDRATDDTPNAR